MYITAIYWSAKTKVDNKKGEAKERQNVQSSKRVKLKL